MSEAVAVVEEKPIREGFGVVEKDRKLARIVVIDDVVKHPNADALELAVIGGWQLCVKLGEYKKGERAVYCEIDSLLPLSNVELFGFLEARRSDNRRVNGENFHRLKTIKLRKELSQGLLVPVPEKYKDLPVDTNLTIELGILKYEPKPQQERDGSGAVNASDWYGNLVRRILKGLDGSLMPWPGQLTKSDQDRVQNKTVAFAIAKENRTSFEVTYKLDGSSMTVFCIDDNGVRTGVCSRNFELSLGDDAPWSLWDQTRYWVGSFLARNRKMFKVKRIHWPEWRKAALVTENNFTRYVKEHEVIQKLKAYQARTGEFITVQGELIGPDIQSNFEGVDKHEYHVFSVYRNGNEEVLPDEARRIVAEIGLTYVPVMHEDFVIGEETTVKDILAMAEGQRAFNQVKGSFREGLVFKARDKVLSWKSISNAYLLKKADE
ncbi:RNA ligase [Pseudomonas phage D6]|nr:RNA ligase [Pseudomonas phage D6]